MSDGIRARIHAVVRAGAQNIKATISPYAKSTFANVEKPYPGRWYQRGYGQKWALKGGGANGRKTSESLGQRWTVKSNAARLSAIIGNNASYSRYVHDAQQQARFHSARGWVTDEEAIEKELPAIERMLKQQIDDELATD